MYRLMFENKCIVLGIVSPRNWCFHAIKGLAFICSVPCCESKNRAEQKGILYCQWDQIAKWVLITVIDNEELAYTIIIFLLLASLVFRPAGSLTIVEIKFRHSVQARHRCVP